MYHALEPASNHSSSAPPSRLAFSGSVVIVLVALTAGLVLAASPTVSFDTTIGPPPSTTSFVKNDIARSLLADRSNNTVDLFNASALTFMGGIGTGGFVGNHPVCAVSHACSGPDGVLLWSAGISCAHASVSGGARDTVVFGRSAVDPLERNGCGRRLSG